MVFSVKYRDSSGAVCEKAVEAANRADCFAKCKAQGIVPIAVVGSLEASKKSGRSSDPATSSKPIVPNAKSIPPTPLKRGRSRLWLKG